jgi:dolichol-phosphate mannosyltransferase
VSLERALVIVPTYNESENLPRLIPSILSRDPRLEVLVVDDASPDGTGRIADEIAAAEPRVHVLHRAGKLGLGTAYLDGFRWGIERGYDVLFEMDADFSHDPAHLPQFLEAIERYDVVLGSRYLHGRVTVVNWPIGRLLLSTSPTSTPAGSPASPSPTPRAASRPSAARCWRRSTWRGWRATATPSRSR